MIEKGFSVRSLKDKRPNSDIHTAWRSQTYSFTKSIRFGRTELSLRLQKALGEIQRLGRVSGPVFFVFFLLFDGTIQMFILFGGR